jgi:hypothetical protein
MHSIDERTRESRTLRQYPGAGMRNAKCEMRDERQTDERMGERSTGACRARLAPPYPAWVCEKAAPRARDTPALMRKGCSRYSQTPTIVEDVGDG